MGPAAAAGGREAALRPLLPAARELISIAAAYQATRLRAMYIRSIVHHDCSRQQLNRDAGHDTHVRTGSNSVYHERAAHYIIGDRLASLHPQSNDALETSAGPSIFLVIGTPC